TASATFSRRARVTASSTASSCPTATATRRRGYGLIASSTPLKSSATVAPFVPVVLRRGAVFAPRRPPHHRHRADLAERRVHRRHAILAPEVLPHVERVLVGVGGARFVALCARVIA